MTEEERQRYALRDNAWALLRQIVGVVQIGAGLGILVNGPATFTLPQFALHAHWFPWWWWGLTAVVSGTLFFIRPVRLVGLCSSALWWTVWSSFLIYGILKVGQPLASAFSYLLIIAIHITLAVVDSIERKR